MAHPPGDETRGRHKTRSPPNQRWDSASSRGTPRGRCWVHRQIQDLWASSRWGAQEQGRKTTPLPLQRGGPCRWEGRVWSRVDRARLTAHDRRGQPRIWAPNPTGQLGLGGPCPTTLTPARATHRRGGRQALPKGRRRGATTTTCPPPSAQWRPAAGEGKESAYPRARGKRPRSPSTRTCRR